ncbi:MAG TPA: SDR family oxidoreductase [Myxococcota bacterium]|nr:SDR family oxidoreductase [Myxococcota bacterium]
MSGSVLVTGASSGIGAATAALLASQGWRVFGTSRRPPAAAQPGVEWIEMDVRDEDSVRAGVALASTRAGPIDALVCSAGFGVFGSIEEVPLETARQQFDTNVFGVLSCVRAVLPDFRSRRAGRIVLVGSLAGRAPIPFQAHYSATKAAVDSLAQALRMELEPFGVAVSLIEPGDIRTAFNDATDFTLASRSAYGARIARCEEVIRRSLDQAPGPAVVARAVVRALCSPRPRTRYPVGPDSRLVPLGRRLLPDWIAERLIRLHFQI